jgi:hypothetical protein
MAVNINVYVKYFGGTCCLYVKIMLLHYKFTEHIHMQHYLLLLQFRLQKIIFRFLPTNLNSTIYIILNLAILRRTKYDIQETLALLCQDSLVYLLLSEIILGYIFYLQHCTYRLVSRSVTYGEV